MIALLTENRALYLYLQSLLSEAGLAITTERQKAALWVVDLDTQKIPEGTVNAVTVSCDPFLLCDLPRPFSNARFLSLCREKLSLAFPDRAFISEREERVIPHEAAPSERVVLDELKKEKSGVLFMGERIALSPAEYRLFLLLLENRGQAVSLEACADAIGCAEGKGNSPSVYIHHLRRKLDYRFHRRMIVTVRQKGYMLLNESE